MASTADGATGPLVRLGRLALGLALLGVGLGWLAVDRDRSDELRARKGELTSARETVSEVDGVVVHSVELASSTGLSVALNVLREPGEAPRPLVVILGGKETGERAVELVGEPRGTVVAALGYPYDGPLRLKGVRQTLGAVPKIREALLDTPAAISLALDHLLARAYVDPSSVELVGASFGAAFVTAAAALDERVTRVWIVHGGADNRAWLAHAIARKHGHRWLADLVAHPLLALIHGRTLDSERWIAALAPRPLVVVAAREDERVPRACVDAAVAAAEGPVELLWTDGGHVDPDDADTVRQLVQLVLERIAR